MSLHSNAAAAAAAQWCGNHERRLYSSVVRRLLSSGIIRCCIYALQSSAPIARSVRSPSVDTEIAGSPPAAYF